MYDLLCFLFLVLLIWRKNFLKHKFFSYTLGFFIKFFPKILFRHRIHAKCSIKLNSISLQFHFSQPSSVVITHTTLLMENSEAYSDFTCFTYLLAALRYPYPRIPWLLRQDKNFHTEYFAKSLVILLWQLVKYHTMCSTTPLSAKFPCCNKKLIICNSV